MTKDKRLSIVAVEQKHLSDENKKSKLERKQDARTKFDRLWIDNPSQFNPERNCMERERLNRTLDLLTRHTEIAGKRVVDLGCGKGIIAERLQAKGATVDAVDVSDIALQDLKKSSSLNPVQDFVPFTKLEDGAYSLVLSTELIGYLPKNERRLYFSELARLVQSDGFVICSTGLDIYTDDALQAFVDLFETEFHPIEWTLASHAFLISIINFLKTSEKFGLISKDQNLRQEELRKLKGLKQLWYRLNTSRFIGTIRQCIGYAIKPILTLFEQNRSLMLWLEKMCKLLKSNHGISHVIVIGQRRPLVIPTREELAAVEPKHKRQVWE